MRGDEGQTSLKYFATVKYRAVPDSASEFGKGHCFGPRAWDIPPWDSTHCGQSTSDLLENFHACFNIHRALL